VSKCRLILETGYPGSMANQQSRIYAPIRWAWLRSRGVHRKREFGIPVSPARFPQ